MVLPNALLASKICFLPAAWPPSQRHIFCCCWSRTPYQAAVRRGQVLVQHRQFPDLWLKEQRFISCSCCTSSRVGCVLTLGSRLTDQPLECFPSLWGSPSRGVQPFGVSGPRWKKKSCLGPHVKYIVTCNHKKTHNVLGKFMSLCRAPFIGILSRMGPVGHRLDTPARGCHACILRLWSGSDDLLTRQFSPFKQIPFSIVFELYSC